MNDARVILADEPTGALDSRSGEEVLRILEELHAEGRTVIVVTHDMDVARRAERIIEIRDGEIISDSCEQEMKTDGLSPAKTTAKHSGASPMKAWLDRFQEAFRMALLSMMAHKLRTFLTMLGIIIGIASVVSVVALGQGSRERVLSNISNLGTNTLEIFAGQDFGDTRSGRITTLVVADADALARQSYAMAVTPTLSTSSTVRFGAEEATAQVTGVGEQYFEASGLTLSEGRYFDAGGVASMAQEVVIDENTRSALFSDTPGSPSARSFSSARSPFAWWGLRRPARADLEAARISRSIFPIRPCKLAFWAMPRCAA